MPEGPEAKRLAYNVCEVIKNKIITDIMLTERAHCSGFEQIIKPLYIADVSAYGKKVLIHVADCTNENYVFIISLGMEGKLIYTRQKHSNIGFQIASYEGNLKEATHDELLALTTITTLYFDDRRYFGQIKLVPLKNLEEELSKLGPDLLQASLTTWITSEDWLTIFKQKTISRWQICKALLEQELVCGIGNYLKNDILYASKILPQRIVADITDEEWETIRIKSHEIIRYSYECSLKGRYKKLIYKQKITPCGCSVVEGKTKDTRPSYWAPDVQK